MRAKLIASCRSSSLLTLPKIVLSLALMFFEKGRWVLAKNFWAAESFLLPLTSIGRWEPLQALDALRY